MTPSLAVVDIDGTLVDTNYQHTLAWHRAFARFDRLVPMWRIHRHIGMGGDQLVGALLGEDGERAIGDAVRDAENEEYQRLIGEVRPLAGARELLQALREHGHAVVLSSSAKEHEVEHYLDLLEARGLVDGWTTSADVEQTKPEPDVVRAALTLAGRDDALMIGDTVWDVEAAARAGIPAVGVLSGGFSRSELETAGAVAVYDDPTALRSALGSPPFAGVDNGRSS